MLLLVQAVYGLHKKKILHGSISLSSIHAKLTSHGAKIILSISSKACLIDTKKHVTGFNLPDLARANKNQDLALNVALAGDIEAVGLVACNLIQGKSESELN